MCYARRLRRRGFTLVELLVVIAIIGTLMGLLLPAVQNAREASRSSSCRANLTQLTLAMTSYEVANKEYPGYVNQVGSLTKTTKASWVAMLLPYLEQQHLWDEYFQGRPAAAMVSTFVCPSNPPDGDGIPAMSYLGNAGYIGDEHLEQEHDPHCAPVENIANGVFVDRVRTFTPDVRDLTPDCMKPASDPVLKLSFATIQGQGDGSTNTLLFSEGLNALYWVHVGGDSPDKKWHFGFCWEQPEDMALAERNSPSRPVLERDLQFRRINGMREVRGYGSLREKTENSGFPSSHHYGGVNVAFVGGAVRFLSEGISPVVYAQLMTTIRKRSDLTVGDIEERDMPVPDPGAL
jgi:prepilin-type N-terminal cleavage/methylation domain-containing protein